MTKRSKCGTSRVVNAGLLSGEGMGYNKVREEELNTQSGTVKVRMQKNTLPEGIYKISLCCFI